MKRTVPLLNLFSSHMRHRRIRTKRPIAGMAVIFTPAAPPSTAPAAAKQSGDVRFVLLKPYSTKSMDSATNMLSIISLLMVVA
jgi:hypothetical protein